MVIRSRCSGELLERRKAISVNPTNDESRILLEVHWDLFALVKNLGQSLYRMKYHRDLHYATLDLLIGLVEYYSNLKGIIELLGRFLKTFSPI